MCQKLYHLIYSSHLHSKPHQVPPVSFSSSFGCRSFHFLSLPLRTLLIGDQEFKPQIETLCKKANQKLHALSRIPCYLSTEQLRHTMSAFILSQFNYCPLVWMLYDIRLGNEINRIHEKGFRIVSKNKVSDFNTLLVETNSVPLHKRNLQLLMIEIYKTVQYLNPILWRKHLY